ncbi:MAG: helix-turn-helix domain-containing protein [Acidobacteriota bacterium]
MVHRIAAAVYDGLIAFEYSIAREILGRDRRELTQDWYEFLPCRVEPGRLYSSHGLEIRPPGTLEDLEQADSVLIAGWPRLLRSPGEPLLEALRSVHARGGRLLTICTGAFALAHAGLLDRRQATTHWLHTELLRTHFPTVRVEEDALYLHDRTGPGQISTSAGCAAGLDLCLAVVREDFGLSIANTIAKRMVAPVHREGGQSQYAESPAGVTEDDRFGPVLDWMVERLDQPFAMEEVARRFGFSLRTFQRRFREITGLSPHQWLVQQRVARARELLESSDHSIEQVATQSGLGSAANLRAHLARHLGTTPRAYRAAFRAVS